MYTSKNHTGSTLIIYRDDSDPQDIGLAYRCGDDSGPIDDLGDLLAVLRDYQPESLDDLPTFGGDEPKDTLEVWSWDETRLLVGTCAADLEIVARPVRGDIDAADIRALRAEAAEASDYDMVAICDRALRGDALAWGECCEVIEDARAQIDG
jgi:hypothetical protein